MADSKSLVSEWTNLNIQEKSFKRLRHAEPAWHLTEAAVQMTATSRRILTEFSHHFLHGSWAQRRRNRLHHGD